MKTFASALLVLTTIFIITGLMLYRIPGAHSQWFWPLAPITVLWSESGGLVIAIIVFLMLIGGSIHVLKQTGLIEGIIHKAVMRYENKAFKLMSILVFIFMSMGAFVGIFEEVVPMVPLMIMLSRGMGWDDLTGLGISVLACGLGFAAAVTNPFTLGVAQELAGLPMFSGALLRVFVFITVYAVLVAYLWRHIQKTKVIRSVDHAIAAQGTVIPKRAYYYFASVMGFMALYIAASPFVEILRDLSLPVIALVFLTAAIGVGLIVNGSIKWVVKQFGRGAFEMAPAIVLILLATGIKHLMVEGHLLDYILLQVSSVIVNFSPFGAILVTYAVVMGLNFFIGSGSAKAFILMPILMPTMDLLGVSRQLGILAFQFGDGFSNILYPTNAVLLIALGLSGVSFGKWFKFIIPVQFVLVLVSIGWLGIAYTLGYGF